MTTCETMSCVMVTKNLSSIKELIEVCWRTLSSKKKLSLMSNLMIFFWMNWEVCSSWQREERRIDASFSHLFDEIPLSFTELILTQIAHWQVVKMTSCCTKYDAPKISEQLTNCWEFLMAFPWIYLKLVRVKLYCKARKGDSACRSNVQREWLNKSSVLVI